MSVPGSVGVVEPTAPSKQIDNVRLTNPSAAAVERQNVVVGDPDNWAQLARVLTTPPTTVDAGMVVRPVPFDNFDSGLVPIPAIEGQLTDTETRVTAVILCNQTASIKKITLKDDTGAIYLNEYPLPARTLQSFPFYGARFASGIRWAAGTTDGDVNGQVVGHQ